MILGEELKGEQKEEDNKVCECEARVRAFMRMIRIGEGTSDEKGYTRLFGGADFTSSPHNKDMITHPQIKVYWYTKKDGTKVYSSAAGAYQVMGYTWNTYINQAKVYGVKDFSPESQDLFCVFLFKIVRQGMLRLIVEGKIKEATEKYGSYEWASLPPGRYGQPNKTMKEALALYDDFLKKELAEDTDLHIKKGFLKRFGMSCKCGSKAKKGVICSNCCKVHVDLRDSNKWQTQFDSKYGSKSAQNTACWSVCRDVLEKYGLKDGSGGKVNPIQTVLEENDKLVVKKAIEGINYLDNQLDKGFPVLVGVDHTLRKNKTKNKDHNEGTTDHFVVIIGKGCDNGKAFYLFYEVGTSQKSKGTSDENKLYLKDDNTLKGTTAYKPTREYTVTQVRKNIE